MFCKNAIDFIKFQTRLWSLHQLDLINVSKTEQRKTLACFSRFLRLFLAISDSQETVPWHDFYGASLIVSLELLERLELLDTRPNISYIIQHLLKFYNRYKNTRANRSFHRGLASKKCLSRIRIFVSDYGSRVKKAPYPRSATKNLSIFIT